MNIGETMTLGRWAGEPIVWRVLKEEDGRVLLISRDILELRPFHPEDEPIGDGDFIKGAHRVDWHTCELRAWLNGAFLNGAFTEEEKARIPVLSRYYTTQYKTLHTFYPGEKESTEQVFLLSQAQAKKLLTRAEDRYAPMTAHAAAQLAERKTVPLRADGSWWTRDHYPGGFDTSISYACNWNGKDALLETGWAAVMTADIGVRPAVWYQL